MGDVLYFAFCQGDQTIRWGNIFLFLKFCMPSRKNQGLLPRKFIISNTLISPNLKEMNWFAFLMTVGSMPRSLTIMGSEKELIKLKSYFALLKPNTGKTLQ